MTVGFPHKVSVTRKAALDHNVLWSLSTFVVVTVSVIHKLNDLNDLHDSSTIIDSNWDNDVCNMVLAVFKLTARQTLMFR